MVVYLKIYFCLFYVITYNAQFMAILSLMIKKIKNNHAEESQERLVDLQ